MSAFTLDAVFTHPRAHVFRVETKQTGTDVVLLIVETTMGEPKVSLCFAEPCRGLSGSRGQVKHFSQRLQWLRQQGGDAPGWFVFRALFWRR